MSERVALAILGGGCAGLSLARALAEQAYKDRVVIIEPRRSYHHDRTWCFWAEAEHQHSEIVSKTWQRWQITTGHVINHTGSRLSYQQIRSDDFYQACLTAIAGIPTIDLRQGLRAETISDQGDHVRVETDAGLILADSVIDTRPRPYRMGGALAGFSGADVETKQPCFDPSTTGLTNMTSDENGLKFTYILPMSASGSGTVAVESRQTHRLILGFCRWTLYNRPVPCIDGTDIIMGQAELSLGIPR